jgi:hypothetical protein
VQPVSAIAIVVLGGEEASCLVLTCANLLLVSLYCSAVPPS